jgi:WD40 repeat protein
MKITNKLLTALGLILSIIIIGIGTACENESAKVDVKSQVSESGEPRLVVQSVVATDFEYTNGSFSNDGKLFALSDCQKGEVIVFEIRTGKLIRKFTDFTDYFDFGYLINNGCSNLLGFSTDGKTVIYITTNFAEYSGSDYISFLDIFNGKVEKKMLPTFNGLGKSKTIDNGDEFQKFKQLTNFYLGSNISVSDDKTLLEIVHFDGTETVDLRTGNKVRETKFKIEKKAKNNELAKSNDGRFVANKNAQGIEIKSVENGKLKLIQIIEFDNKIIPQNDFTENGFYSFNALNGIDENSNQIALRNESQNTISNVFKSDYFSWSNNINTEIVASVSTNGERLATIFNNELEVFISPKGSFVAVSQTGQVFEVNSGREIYQTKNLFTDKFNDVGLFSADERTIVFSNAIIDTKTWKTKHFSICYGNYENNSSIIFKDIILIFDELDNYRENELCTDYMPTHINLSPNGKFLTVAGTIGDDIEPFFLIWDLVENKRITYDKSEINDLGFVSSTNFSNNNSFIVIPHGIKVKVFDINTGKKIIEFIGHSDRILGLQFSLDGKLLLSESKDNTSKIWDVSSGKELLQMVKYQNGDWIVTTPDGRFDTNNLDKVEGMHWIMPSEPLRPLPIEIFMRQYYEPKLLARVLKCNEEKNCEQEFKPLPALNTLNRTQPSVKITEVKPDSEGTVEITVEVANTKSEGQKDTFGNPLESGVNDVRLFRDGQLVGYAPKTNQTEQTTWEWLKSFVVKSSESASNKVELDQDGKATLKFSKIKLPKTGIDKVEFSAYAFNVDQIKSETSRKTYEFKANTVKGRAYIISMGVNANEKQGSDLRFAANDARQSLEILGKRLLEQGQYEEVVNIPLISDFTVAVNGNAVQAKDATVQQIKTGQKTVTENTATKAHFKAVLDVLAGRQTNTELLKTIQNADKLRQANPEDLIIFSVSSHGSADKNGIFYLLASDGNTISSDELSVWLRDVDGGELALIIDACHSASAVETADFKPAPMNSRGLGQLSYDKGMRILTATQADNVALETNKTRQGLLSYALLQNGLNDFQADFKPQDRTIVMSEWLNFGVERVPRLWEESQSGQVKVVRETNDTAEAETQQKQEKTQQPSLFDFSRKNRDVTLEKRGGSVPNPVIEAPKVVQPVSTPTTTPSQSPVINSQNFNGRVIKTDCRIREFPSTDANVVGKLDYNAPINIGEQQGRWFRVTTATGLQGWMDGDLIEYTK